MAGGAEPGRDPGVDGGGGMSVLRTRVAFFFGFGAAVSAETKATAAEMDSRIGASSQRPIPLMTLTILVFAHVKPAQEHDGPFAEVSAHALERGVGIEHGAGVSWIWMLDSGSKLADTA